MYNHLVDMLRNTSGLISVNVHDGEPDGDRRYFFSFVNDHFDDESRVDYRLAMSSAEGDDDVIRYSNTSFASVLNARIIDILPFEHDGLPGYRVTIL